ncbi:hypothetical protein BJ170DRAFT_628712 [Xylariales sp. AK1849]|nr:hypothetical protein BJ170DRAFT_628712 [Xylariales sp. AK1849]
MKLRLILPFLLESIFHWRSQALWPQLVPVLKHLHFYINPGYTDSSDQPPGPPITPAGANGGPRIMAVLRSAGQLAARIQVAGNAKSIKCI